MKKGFQLMTDPISTSLILLAVLAMGIFIGYFLSRFKFKSRVDMSEEKYNQQKLQLEEVKNNYISQLGNIKEINLDSKVQFEKQLFKTESERESIRKEKDFLSTELATRNSEFESLARKNEEQKKEVEDLQQRFSKEFENLANRIFEQKSEKFTLLNKENIQNLLDPLGEKIKSFEQKVDKNNTDFIQRHAQLGEQLQHLNTQNLKISEEAINLTKAL